MSAISCCIDGQLFAVCVFCVFVASTRLTCIHSRPSQFILFFLYTRSFKERLLAPPPSPPRLSQVPAGVSLWSICVCRDDLSIDSRASLVHAAGAVLAPTTPDRMRLLHGQLLNVSAAYPSLESEKRTRTILLTIFPRRAKQDFSYPVLKLGSPIHMYVHRCGSGFPRFLQTAQEWSFALD